MPKRLAEVTRQDAIDCAVEAFMQSIASGINSAMVVVQCDEQEKDGTPHYCMYNVAAERGWMTLKGELVNSRSGDKALAYELTIDGVDAFCHQHLARSAKRDSAHWEEGVVVDLIRDLFHDHPRELKEWKDVVREHRVSEALNGD